VAEENLRHLRHLTDLLADFGPLLGQVKVRGLLAIGRAARNGGGGG